MADKDNSRGTPAEYIFDITKPSDPIEFCGLIDGLVGPGNGMTGMFKWTCPACGRPNHDAVGIQPNRSFLAEWSCNHCDDPMIVRFHARPPTDWIAQHALAITGTALCHLAEKELPSYTQVRPPRRSGRSGQKMFAWIAIPLLTVIITVEAMDFRRIETSSAYSRYTPARSSSSYSWLGGRWVSESSGDTLTFGYMNPAAGCGAYTRATRDGAAPRIVRFEIIHEETTDGRLILRELTPAPDTATPQDNGSDAILYITRHGDSLTRMITSRGTPVMTTYYRTGKTSDQ
jgi:hypothetical protein